MTTTPTVPGCDVQPGTRAAVGPLDKLRPQTATACTDYNLSSRAPGSAPRIVEAYLGEALSAVATELHAAEHVREQLIRAVALTTTWGPRQLARVAGIPVSTAARALNELRKPTA